jgi:hypothetical protein
MKMGKESGYLINEFIKHKVDNVMKYQDIKALKSLRPAEEVNPK